jgi:exopolysaccharide biosynthesis WecB/TagA/CpsF family protein
LIKESGALVGGRSSGAPIGFESPPAAVQFGGLRLTPMGVEEAVARLAARPADAPFDVLSTPNVEHAYLRRRSAAFRRCGDDCFISTNDSRVLRGAARLAGLELEFAPGAYVVDRMFRTVVESDTAISIIGGSVEVTEALKAQFGLTNVVQHIPPMGFIRDPAAVAQAVDFVAAHPCRYVFVAMGPPQSEEFCQKVIEDGRSTGVGLCIGSSLLVLTGASQPAPDWMEQSGLVWLYRLIREPRRLWRRYLLRGSLGLALCLRDVIAIRLGLSRPYRHG